MKHASRLLELLVDENLEWGWVPFIGSTAPGCYTTRYGGVSVSATAIVVATPDPNIKIDLVREKICSQAVAENLIRMLDERRFEIIDQYLQTAINCLERSLQVEPPPRVPSDGTPID